MNLESRRQGFIIDWDETLTRAVVERSEALLPGQVMIETTLHLDDLQDLVEQASAFGGYDVDRCMGRVIDLLRDRASLREVRRGS